MPTTFSGPTGQCWPRGEPPHLVRVAGNIASQTRSVNGSSVAEVPRRGQISACPYVKLSIATPASFGRVIIDCDSSIVLPTEEVCDVQVLALPGWVEPGPTLPRPESDSVWDVHGNVKICDVADGLEVYGRLTEFLMTDGSQTATFVRPRTARRVFFFSQPTAQTWNLFAGIPGAGGQNVGTLIVAANSIEPVDMMPGVTHVQSSSFPDPVMVGVVWELQPL